MSNDKNVFTRLVRFLRARMVVKLDGAPIAVFKISHAQEGTGKKNTLEDRTVSKDDTPEGIAQDLLSAAQDDTNELQGTHQYTVEAYYGTDEVQKGGGRIALRLTSEADDDEDGNLHFSANEKSIVAQLQRHVEAQARTNAIVVEGSMRTIANFAESVFSRFDSMVGRVFDSVIQTQNLLDRKSERELVVRREIQSDKRMERLFDMGEKYVPALLMSRQGGSISMLPPAMVTLVKSLASDRSRMDQLLAIATPEEKMLIISMMVTLKEAEDAEAAAKLKEDKEINGEVAGVLGEGSK